MNSMSSDFNTVSGSASREPDLANWDWADRGTTHVLFSKNEPLPIQEGDVLGHGVNGPVTQAVIKGVRVALKRIYCRQGVAQKNLQEIEIIRKLKHPHIIQLAGSFTRGQYLGLLLYPVATCDLATFLEDVNFLLSVERKLPYPPGTSSEFEERTYRCAMISRVNIKQQNRAEVLNTVTRAASARIWESYGCITSAASYLHQNSIRHKDLKPLNILLSYDGLWITDFGHSTDFSEFSTSATTGGERGTIKYCAPEVAAFVRSGRSADVFSLGCIFFEMAALRCYTLEKMKDFRPSMDRSFHNNLDNIWPIFDTFGSTALDHLPMSLVKRMISKDPADRPDLETISRVLDFFQVFSTVEPETFPRVWCSHRTPVPLGASPFIDTFIEELVITIGNTCHKETSDFVVVEGEKRVRIPVVIFVGCSSVDYIDSVIFLQHSSSSKLSVVVSKPPFARRSTIWGTFTQAVLVVLKPGYRWCSDLASPVPLGTQGLYQSVLPMTWHLQEDMYASDIIRVPISREHYSGA